MLPHYEDSGRSCLFVDPFCYNSNTISTGLKFKFRGKSRVLYNLLIKELILESENSVDIVLLNYTMNKIQSTCTHKHSFLKILA
jgi:hypothetical protein